ncbi:unnamed protein product [Rhodiola kirilowii]
MEFLAKCLIFITKMLVEVLNKILRPCKQFPPCINIINTFPFSLTIISYKEKTRTAIHFISHQLDFRTKDHFGNN